MEKLIFISPYIFCAVVVQQHYWTEKRKKGEIRKLQLESIYAMVTYILGLGPVIMMPIVLFILAMIFRQPIGKSIRSAVIVGVAFIGINAVLGAVFGVLGPAVGAFVSRTGVTLKGLDVGWPLTSAITWAVPTAALILPIGFVVNVVLLVAGLTKTFDADIWNYWHWAFTAVMVEMATGSMWIGLIAGIIAEVGILFLGDWTAPLSHTYFKVPGCSQPHTETVNWAPVAMALEKVFRKIPGLSKSRTSPDVIRDKVGFMGEPVMIGVYVGIFLGVLAWLPPMEIVKLAFYMGALLLLEGRMIGILMEGLMPLADGIRDYFAKSKTFKGRELFIGIDAGPIGLSDPSSIAVGLILIPLYIGLALVPGNLILPAGDLSIVPIFGMWSCAAAGGDILRGILGGAVSAVLVMYITNAFAAPLTAAAAVAKFAIPAGILWVSSLDAGGHIFPWIVMTIFMSAGTGNMSSLMIAVVAGVLYVGCYFFAKEMPEKVAKELRK